MSFASGSAGHASGHVRYRGAAQVGYVSNVDPPRFLLSSAVGSPRANDALEEIAMILMKIDFELIKVLKAGWEYLLTVPESEFSLEQDPASKEIVRNDLKDIAEINAQLLNVRNGKCQIHEDYPKDRSLIRFWDNGFKVLSQLLDGLETPSSANFKDTAARVHKIEDCVSELRDVVLNAAGKIFLDRDLRRALREKWLVLDEGLDNCKRKTETFGRKWPKWSNVLGAIDKISKAAFIIDPAPFVEAAQLKGAKKTRSAQGRKLDLILWLTFVGTALIGVPSMGMAIKYSTSDHGKWSDPDFWFLVQSSSFQFCGLLITGLTFWKDASHWNWLPIGIALLCVMAGPVLYCEVPAWVGVLSNTLAGFVQALFVLRGAISEHSK